MAFYIKVTKDVADALRLTGIRNRTADGNILLWQADIAAVPGETVFKRAEHVGGVALLPQQAKAEIEGTDNPASVTTPEEYKLASEELDEGEES